MWKKSTNRKPKPEISHPKSSTAKRSLEKADHDEVRKKKRSKTEKQRIEAAFERISVNASQSQVTDKVRKLKQNIANTVRKSIQKGKGGEDNIVFSRDVKQKVFELSRKIWGSDGALPSKSMKKLGGKQNIEEEEKPSTPLSSGVELVSYWKAEKNHSLALDEATALAYWNMAADGRKKRALEEMLKRIKAKEMELCLERSTLVTDTLNFICKEDIGSSSGNVDPMLSQNEAAVDVSNGNERKETVVDHVNKETCIAPDDGINNVETGLQDIEEEKDVCEDLEIEQEEADDVVASDANIEEKNEASVTSDAIEKEEVACVASDGIKERSVSRKKLLVLDLNGLLADIVSTPAVSKPDIIIKRRAIFKRPFCEEFLKFCFDKFEVGIWSSRKQENVEGITEFLLGDMKSKLLFSWDMSYCTKTTLTTLENRHKPVVFKDLNKLWEKQHKKLPWEAGDYNKTNTVLLDDSPYKALLNPPYTAIFPHSYHHQNKKDASLGNGGDLRLYLEKLVEAENVQDFIKMNPFGQESITEASDSWEFYRLAIPNSTCASKNLRSNGDDGKESFAVGTWEEKEVISREGHMKLKTNVIFASIDQRSKQAGGESACTVLVAVIADWFNKNGNLMPSKSQFDSLIREGSLEWRKLCENETYMQRFPDKHFDLDTVLQAKVRSSLTVVNGKSYTGFFQPEGMTNEGRLEFLQQAMSFDSMWDEIFSLDDESDVYIVSWNDHFFVLKVEKEAYYIIDTFGERLYEGCDQAYILKFDDKTIISKNLDGSESEIVVCRGKESCKEYIKSFLAAIPIRDLQEDIKKGLASTVHVHHRLQIEFHYTKMTTDAENCGLKS
ncbi:uncharacterized protein LOC112083427 [Eutrema salsugineum]|uniref:uncharacterized protein LOC112083427 n=1 Tax=Eutrema salsugineum TaxID=72664 RepID=UPI000CED4DE6|nr:uncharacterized protein LOC112083427 [Eutrema salsugineum]